MMKPFLPRHAPQACLASLLALSGAFAQAPSISFTGYADADFATSFAGGNLKDPRHLTGLEVDLATTVTFNPRLNAVLYTTMTDGAVPAQGAGNTWAPVLFDGVTLNWRYDDATTIHVGDLIHGTGYFNYYLNKRSAVVVGEHTVRGAGFTRKGLTVATGVSGLGATDTAGAPTATSQWATFAQYVIDLGRGISLTPSAKYTAGVPGATPFTGGLSFDGAFGAFTLSADAAVNYYSPDHDPGFTLLVEPLYTYELWTFAGALFANVKGSGTLMAPNTPSQTLTGKEFDDLFVYVEPGRALNKTVSLGLPVEFHDAAAATAVAQGYDQSFWVVPTLYIYPGSGVQWWIWAQIVKPLTAPASSTAPMGPQYFAGSEIIFRF